MIKRDYFKKQKKLKVGKGKEAKKFHKSFKNNFRKYKIKVVEFLKSK